MDLEQFKETMRLLQIELSELTLLRHDGDEYKEHRVSDEVATVQQIANLAQKVALSEKADEDTRQLALATLMLAVSLCSLRRQFEGHRSRKKHGGIAE